MNPERAIAAYWLLSAVPILMTIVAGLNRTPIRIGWNIARVLSWTIQHEIERKCLRSQV